MPQIDYYEYEEIANMGFTEWRRNVNRLHSSVNRVQVRPEPELYDIVSALSAISALRGQLSLYKTVADAQYVFVKELHETTLRQNMVGKNEAERRANAHKSCKEFHMHDTIYRRIFFNSFIDGLDAQCITEDVNTDEVELPANVEIGTKIIDNSNGITYTKVTDGWIGQKMSYVVNLNAMLAEYKQRQSIISNVSIALEAKDHVLTIQNSALKIEHQKMFARSV